MGVLGLWQLLAPIGQPVTLESLENKILAVDISIWLNKAIKGYRDSKGASVPNAHLLSLFSRLCKLLFYKIRPVIVFDGGVPELKKQTIINRQQRRAALKETSNDAHLKLLASLLASKESTSKKIKSKPVISSKSNVPEDLFDLPDLQEDLENDEESTETNHHNFSHHDLKYLDEIDIESEDFKVLPLDIQQEILTNLKESRRHQSWSYYENLPKESNEFSNYQMQNLLKRRKLQGKIEEVQKNMQHARSHDYISLYVNEQMMGDTSKIMSDDTSHYILMKKTASEVANVAGPIKTTQTENKIEASVIELNNESEYENGDSEISVTDSSNNDFEHYMTNSDEEECVHIEANEFPLKATDSIAVGEFSSISKDVIIVKSDVDIKIVSQSDPSKNNSKTSNQESCSANLESTDLQSKYMEKLDTDSSIDIFATPTYQAQIDSNPEVLHKSATTETSQNNIELSLNDQTRSLDTEKLEVPEQVIIQEEENKMSASPNEFTSPRHNEQGFGEPNEHQHVNSVEKEKGVSPKKQKSVTEVELEFESMQKHLQSDQAKYERQARTVQDHMYEECKDLLRLFGVPYIVSPMEAEAQCAFYDLEGITHGTITEDSDVWLFGGKRVYKNFFTQNKYVEFYKNIEILSHFGMDRTRLINFAMLTGSDYTDGIEGVGPVTAMEIISEFKADGLESLDHLKAWWKEAQCHATPAKNKVRAKLQKLSLSDSFPIKAVYETYLNPAVDNSTEMFSWGIPDLDALRDYTKQKFGWKKSKVDETLLPVIKRLNERDRQMHLDSYFSMNLKKEKNLFPSKRMTSALKKLNYDCKNNECDDPCPPKIKKTSANCNISHRTKKTKNVKTRKNLQQASSSKISESVLVLSEDSSSE